MAAGGLFVLPHTGPQTFASFSDILKWTLAAFKAVDDIRFLIWFQGVLGSYQGGAEDLHGFMRDQYAMFDQNAHRCLRCFLYIRDLYKACLLLHYGTWSTGLETSSNEMPVIPVLLADPVKVLSLFSFRICSGAVRLHSTKNCA